MKKITIIFTCLLLIILGIGCGSASAASSLGSDLSSNYGLEHVSSDDSIHLQRDTQMLSNAIGSVECESGSNLCYSSSMDNNVLRPIIGPKLPSTYDNGGSYSNDQNKTINAEVKDNLAASFSDLNNEIKSISSGSTLNLNRDYVYSDKDSLYKSGIVIDMDNITINGNGHYIDAKKSASIFKVTGNHVHLSNLIFLNAKCMSTEGSGEITQTKSLSGINWIGNNGVLSDSILKGNIALNGGAITWMANDGLINNITAIDNLASGVGGAIYIGGKNNIISNSSFCNSSSLLTGESIYVDCNRENLTLINCTSSSDPAFVDGMISNIDVDYLKYSFNTLVSDKTINLVDKLYSCLMYNSLIDCGDGILASSFYNNETEDFTLSLYRAFTGGFAYKKIFHFSKMNNPNDVFNALLNHGYSIELTLIKTINVTNKDSYAYACNYNRDDLYNEPGIKNIINDFWNNPADKIVYALDVNFPKPISLFSNLTWDTKKKRLDVIAINGCGSHIHISNDKKAEAKWAILAPGCVFTIDNLTVGGFNNAIVNQGGYGLLYNSKFDGNKMDYTLSMDWGAGILNAGYILCSNCTFSNNYAKNGAAIFNQGHLELNNCTFLNNNAYGEGNEVCSVDKASVMVDKEKIEGSQGVVTYLKSLNAAERIAIQAASYVASFAAGFAAGFFTANPVIGMAAGVAAGAAIGAIAAGVVVKYSYDINFNRFTTALELISGCVGFGMLGGAFGGMVGDWYYYGRHELPKMIFIGGRIR